MPGGSELRHRTGVRVGTGLWGRSPGHPSAVRLGAAGSALKPRHFRDGDQPRVVAHRDHRFVLHTAVASLLGRPWLENPALHPDRFGDRISYTPGRNPRARERWPYRHSPYAPGPTELTDLGYQPPPQQPSSHIQARRKDRKGSRKSAPRTGTEPPAPTIWLDTNPTP